MVPFKYKNTGIYNDTVYVIRKQIVMGLLYTFLLWTLTSSEPLEHHFAVSRDRNLRYHIFKHTLADFTANYAVAQLECSSEVDKCGDGVLNDVLTPQSFRAANSSTQVLKVASYNIWNVNSVEDKGEKYETRLKRLNKVNSREARKEMAVHGTVQPPNKEYTLAKCDVEECSLLARYFYYVLYRRSYCVPLS